MNLTSMNKDDIFPLMFQRENKQEESTRLWLAYVNNLYLKSFKMILEQE